VCRGEDWEERSDIETKWSVLKTALCEEAEELGVEDIRQPDWFQECGAEIKPKIAEEKTTYFVVEHWAGEGLLPKDW